jgi:hypothetical protein
MWLALPLLKRLSRCEKANLNAASNMPTASAAGNRKSNCRWPGLGTL